MIKVTMLRHFATKGNLEKRYVGSTDEPILEKNFSPENKNIEEKRINMNLNEIEAVYVSPLLRCVQTAEIVFPNFKMIRVPDLKESDFGKFEYKNHQELEQNTSYQRWIDSNGTIPFPKGESRESFQRRCTLAFEGIMRGAEGKGYKEIALVVHGGTIMSILDRFSHPHVDFFQWQLENGRGYRMEWDTCGRLENICCIR